MDAYSRSERDEARARLKASVDALTEQASLQVQMQKDPLKMLGGASAVGALVGMAVGRQFRRSKKIYVDATSPAKHQKALIKAQHKQQGGKGVGGALVATLTTLAFKALNERVLTPKLEEIAGGLMEKAGQEPGQGGSGQAAKASPRSSAATPTSSGGAASFLKRPDPAATASKPAYAEQSLDQAVATGSPTVAAATAPTHVGVLPTPKSMVEAKAQGTPIAPDEKVNPNLR
ncbi:hypothetical protein QOL99_03485 [Deinococcus sp. MIMF12]|uniref:DUF3618 domain-containing protein n=1 Tax=Deinococcus rhizophilus TaxID=3049544 RepID=A0ABT7JDT2_9DEIO|nr:hypothetical protein [Deinococcus rhizophilus]MDL2343207.1 hypothetical protein [Deinococcus rhizophilus]